jgi:signal transduction histidine kinase
LGGVKIKIRKIILTLLIIIGILSLGKFTRNLLESNLSRVEIIDNDSISMVSSSSGTAEEDARYILGNDEDNDTWTELKEIDNVNTFIGSNDFLYVKIKANEGTWTNLAIYLRSIKGDSYEAFFNGRKVYESPKGFWFSRDLDLDIIYKDAIIPLGKPKGLDDDNTIRRTNRFNNEDALVLKITRGVNGNMGLPIKEAGKNSILIGEHKDIISYTMQSSIKKIVLNSVIAAVAVVVAILGLLLKGRDRKSLLSLSVFSLCMGIYGITNLSSINAILVDAPIIWEYLFYISFALAPYTFASFFENLLGEHSGAIKVIRKIQALAALLFMITIILYSATSGIIDVTSVGRYVLYASLLLLITATLIITVIGSFKGSADSQVLTFGIVTYVFYVIHALVTNTYINEFGLILFVLSLILITARRFVSMNVDIVNNSKELEAKNQALQAAWEEISCSQNAISELNKTLEQRVIERTQDLEKTNQDLKVAMETLKLTQGQLIQSEKMVALGGLVAGVSHEINTPVGVSVTAASHLQEKTKELAELFSKSLMKKSDLEKYLNLSNESSEVILANLQRASELIRSFKQVAVDQSNEEKRSFKIKEYLSQVLLSLKPKLKKTNIVIGVNCEEDLEVHSFPGAFSQIITNLVMNSLVHAFEEGQEGTIIFDIEKQDNSILFTYSDNGKGIDKEIIGKIFDPFFTTKRGHGGTGLGLNIIYNIVTQTLGGTITCESEAGTQTMFKIVFPVDL